MPTSNLTANAFSCRLS